MTRRRVAFHWSGGKDSALGLSLLLRDESVVVEWLVTTIHRDTRASTVHGIPVELVQAQADSIGIPLHPVTIPGPGLDGYVEAMADVAADARRADIDTFAFGDLQSSGVIAYKQDQFGPLGIDILEPLWELTPRECIEQFLSSGIRAVTVVVDAAALGVEAVGVALDRDFIDRLPDDVDPCGELGEFHSFAFDGPLFTTPVDFVLTPPRTHVSRIRTTEGLRTYTYWLATPMLPSGGQRAT